MNMGMVFTATDLASNVVNKLGANFMRFDKIIGGTSANFTKHMASFALGLASVKAGLKVLSIPGKFISEAANVQDTMFQIKSVSGLATNEINQMRKNFLKLSADLPVSAQALANVGVSAAQLGIQGREEIERFSVSTIKLSKVLPELTPEAAGEGLAQLSNVLDVNVKDLDRLGSAMVKMKTTSTATGTDIVQAARRFGAFATKLGFTADQVIAYSAAFRDAGVTSEVGATAIQQVFTRMSTKTDQFAKLMGITTKQLQANMKKDLPGAINQFLGTLSKMDAQKVPGVLKELQLSGARTIPVILGLTKAKVNLAQKLKDSAEAYAKGTLMQERFMELTKSFNAVMDTLSGSIQNIFIALGTPLLEPATNSVKAFLSVLNPFLARLQDSETLARNISFTLLTLGTTLVGGGLFVTIVSGVAMAQSALAFFGVSVSGIIGGLLTTLGSAIPPILAFAAVAGAVYLAWTNNFAGIKDAFYDTLFFLQLGYNVLLELFTGGQLESYTRGLLKNLGLDGFVNKLFSIRTSVVSFFRGLADGFQAVFSTSNLYAEIEQAVRALFSAFGDLGKSILDLVGSFGLFQGIGNTAFGDSTQAGFQFGTILTSVVVPVIKLIIDGLTFLISIVTAVVDVFNSLNNAFGGGILNGVVSFIGLILSSPIGVLVGAFNPLVGVILLVVANWNLLVSAFQGAQALFGSVMGWVLDFVFMVPVHFSNMVTAITNFFSALPGQILNFILNIPAYVIGVFAVMAVGLAVVFVGLLEFAINTFKSIINFIVSIPGYAVTAITFLVTSFVAGFSMILNFATMVITGIITFIMSLPGVFATAASAAFSAFVSVISGIPGFVGGIVSAVVGFFMGLPGQLASIARSAAAGFINALTAGIKGQISRITSTVKSMVGAVRNLLPGSDAKTGPLSDLTHSGSMLPVTFAYGIQNASAAPVEAVIKSVAPIQNALNADASTESNPSLLGARGGESALERLVPPAPAAPQVITAQAEPVVVTQERAAEQPRIIQILLDGALIKEQMEDEEESLFRRGFNL